MARKVNPELSARVATREANTHLFNDDGTPKRLMWCCDRVRIGWDNGIDVPCPFTQGRVSYADPDTMLPPIGVDKMPEGQCCKTITDRPFGSKVGKKIKTAQQIAGDEAHSPGMDSLAPVATLTLDDVKRIDAGLKKSWCAVGIDTSMTSIAVVVFGYDGVTDKRKGPFFGEIRWQPDTGYWTRLAQALTTDALVNSLVAQTWARSVERTLIAIEEPWYYGAVKTAQSGYLKQQAEIAGVVKASLVKGGYTNMSEINNSQWHAALRAEGVVFEKAPQGSLSSVKAKVALANKFKVKEWAIQAFGLPDLPDLVASKSGAKIPRPESGYGANAKAVQPSDVYDAAACCAWQLNVIEEEGV